MKILQFAIHSIVLLNCCVWENKLFLFNKMCFQMPNMHLQLESPTFVALGATS